MTAVDDELAVVSYTNCAGHLVGIGLIRADNRTGLCFAAVVYSEASSFTADV